MHDVGYRIHSQTCILKPNTQDGTQHVNSAKGFCDNHARLDFFCGQL